MVFSIKNSLFSILIFTALCTTFANADCRAYVWTCEYMTMPKGQSEPEYYLTTKIPDLHDYDNKIHGRLYVDKYGKKMTEQEKNSILDYLSGSMKVD